jgi:putative N6-adenine-specific DNA methylase
LQPVNWVWRRWSPGSCDDLGIDVLETADARVSFSGGVEAMVKSLLWLRTAERVLLVVDEFDAEIV